MSSVTFIISALLLVLCSAVFAVIEKDVCYSDNALVATTYELRKAIRCELEDALETITRLVIPGNTQSNPACSCTEILELFPNAPSGYYWIKTEKRGCQSCAKLMYCDMDKTCNGVGGGWMKVAAIDSSECPPGLKTITKGSRRICAMDIDGPGCSSAILPVEGVKYSRVCGKIIGYQDGSPDGFFRFSKGHTTVDSNYVDGISLTHGFSPREHIWTFAAALQEEISDPRHYNFLCPCANMNNPSPTAAPSFVGQNYFCDTASESLFKFIFYEDDPLWDGAGCGKPNTCCEFNSPPWFLRELQPTCDDIEIRLCSDQDRHDEDINFEILEIYVQ